MIEKDAANYGPGMGETKCKNCQFFRVASCNIVAGRIDPEYWCKFFLKARGT